MTLDAERSSMIGMIRMFSRVEQNTLTLGV